MRTIILISLLLFSLSCGNAIESENIVYYTKQDSTKCVAILNHSFDNKAITTSKVAKLFLGAPYQGGTLDRDTVERVVVRLDSLDCTTFVESVSALTLCVNSGKNKFSDFLKALENIRYRNGVCNGYTSRLHYFSEWIMNNQEMGIIKDVYVEGVTKTEERTINFMSSNSEKYNGISNNSVLAQIKATEAILSSIPFSYIPKDKIGCLNHETIHEGDIIAIVTDIDGLDISHVGFATFVDGEVYLLHASSAKKEVIIDPLTLTEYLAKFKRHVGIKILRPLF
ncbi:MAG: DUF1460 domain-containing protein [Muribaculaceae bacterium]|nr:DUF1460 domain-containing protein [Muribaculaceae bacterium]